MGYFPSLLCDLCDSAVTLQKLQRNDAKKAQRTLSICLSSLLCDLCVTFATLRLRFRSFNAMTPRKRKGR